MAKVTALKPNGNGETPAAEDKPVARETPRLPLPHSRNLTIEQFIEYWKSVDIEFRQRLIGYLYRLWPIINREPHYIDKFTAPPESRESILQEWGTGEYQIRLLDTDKPKGGPVCQTRFKFSESHTEYEPILDPLELDLGRRENQTIVQYFRSKGKLRVPGDQPASSAADSIAVKALADIATKKQEPQETLESEAASSAFKIMTTATAAAIDSVKSQNDPGMLLKLAETLQGKQGDSLPLILKLITDQQGTTTTLLTKMIEAGNKSAPAIDPIVLKLITDSQARTDALLMKLMDKDKNVAGVGSVREIAETIASLREVFAGEGGRRGDKWWHAVLDNPSVNRTLETVGGALLNWSQAQAIMRQPGFGQQPPSEPAPPGTSPINPPAPSNLNPAPQNEESMNLQALGDFLMPRFAAFMQALDGGIKGGEFAQELYETNPLLGGMDLGTHAQIKALGRDKILSMLNVAPPQVKQLLAGKQSMVVTFLDEFLAWVPQEEIPLPSEMPGERP